MPEYVAEIRFHIFPFRKLKISAKDEQEAKKIAINQAEEIKNTLSFTLKSLKKKQVLIDDFL